MTQAVMPCLLQHTIADLVAMSEATDNEICGYIFKDGTIWYVTNMASNPKTSFFMDPDDSMYIQRTTRDMILGIFHSHPGGSVKPSEHDLAGWPKGLPWDYYIVSGGVVRKWVRENNVPTIAWSS